MNKHLRYMLPFCLLATVHCAALDKNKSGDTETQWAHFPANSLTGGILGRIETQKKNLVTKKNLMICVETSRADYDATELLLDVKLAYASWIQASQIYGASEFSALEFKPQKLCPINSEEFASNVVVATNKVSQIDNHQKVYSQAKGKCTARNGSINCQGEGFTLGFGGPGNYSVRFIPSNGKWTEVIYKSPATATLSPFVKWNSLRATLEQSQLAKDIKDGLIGRYNGLKQDSKYEALVDLLDALKRNQVLDNEDPAFRAEMNKILHSRQQGEVPFTYTPSKSALQVLIHEVGHQFGMDHAHEPNGNSVTGTAKEGEVENGAPATEMVAAMAYGKPYLHLTSDDVAGVIHAAIENRKFIAEKTGQ